MKHPLIAKGLKLFPACAVSRAFGVAAEISLPSPAQRLVNNAFAKIARIDVAEAAEPIDHYESLNALFTRTLKAGARTFSDAPNDVCAPSDGRLSDFGKIEDGQIIEAKGQSYSAAELLGTSEFDENFRNGYYFTIYLSPQNYHRIHTPFAGDVSHMAYVPGRLFPVNRLGLSNIEKLFPQNERLTSFIQNNSAKKLAAVVKVGATCVGKISVVYDEFLSNQSLKSSFLRPLADNYALQSGDELGCFNLGSTVVLLIEGEGFQLNKELKLGQKIKAGEILGSYQ
ncbi:MAG: archaetidylserine decarboxylase [Bradymonadia bacterium]|jgi:phosphatidylserine decarboxylase